MGKLPQVSYVSISGATGGWRSELKHPRQGGQRLQVGSPAWFAWLAAPMTTSFSYPIYDPTQGYIAGFVTVRKEQRQRGGTYWVAYHRCQGRVRKRYLGATSRLTQACLDSVADMFRAVHSAPCQPGAPTGDSN